MATGQVLVSNDDGVNAPGLRVLASALVRASTDVVVCGPSRERSAQSHALSLGPTLSAAPIKVDGVDDAWAVEGTPADSVALALNSPILKRRDVKLVVSGINRGHNCGLHVIYSGTVGAAREAAIQGLPAVALSLDNSKARATDAYEAGAALSVALVRALEGALPGQESRTAPLEALKGVVVNVNIPSQWLADGGSIRGFHFCSQGTFCSFAHFKEMPSLEGDEVRHDPNDPDGQLVFKAFPGPSARCAYRRAFRPGRDDTEGCDTWAMEHGWISVTLLRLRQDVTCMKTPEEGRQLAALAEAVAAAAAYSGVEAAGFSPSPAL